MSEAGWLVVAIVAGVLFAFGWIKRERWIARRRAARATIRAHLGLALDRTLNVQRVRLACGHRAPPRSWTLSSL